MSDSIHTQRGRQNSSITRVRPILGQLLRSVESGRDRLRKLLELTLENTSCVEHLIADPGAIVTDCRRKRSYNDRVLGTIELEGAFEWKVPPPGAFLRYLIENSGELQKVWVKKREDDMGEETRQLRRQLIEEQDIRTSQRALLELDAVGAQGSERKWWAFEGFTEVDCLIETEKLVLFIEGKRNESLSCATDWFPLRNQLARNLECARQYAAPMGKEFAVLLMTEAGIGDATEQSLERIQQGFPHLDKGERGELCRHFLGEVHWQSLREPWGLTDDHFPDSIEEVR